MYIKALFFLIALLSSYLVAKEEAVAKWEGTIPSVAQDSAHWQQLLQELSARNMNYGRLAAASRMLLFFSDLPTKELAYKTIVDVIDEGYPFSTRALFISGDLDPRDDDDFSNSYNLYKGMISEAKGMKQWADHYFSQVDKEKFSKYLFFTAIQNYREKNLDAAETALKKLLSLKLGPKDASLAKKSARTLARLYFERGQYPKSLEIYQTFLLKLNPMAPSDWLEAAWNLFYLKRYEEALGLLFNLESRSMATPVLLEKFLLRGLIYQAYCSTGNMAALLRSFDQEFGPTISAIKAGETLTHLPKLRRIAYGENSDFEQAEVSLRELKAEATYLKYFSGGVENLAHYLYSTEITFWAKRVSELQEQSSIKLASYLVTTSESLRFLKFDVARGQFDSEALFAPMDRETKPAVEDVAEVGFQIRWLQKGDFWRDERTRYQGVLKNKCSP